jgi:hypothetical protein
VIEPLLRVAAFHDVMTWRPTRSHTRWSAEAGQRLAPNGAPDNRAALASEQPIALGPKSGYTLVEPGPPVAVALMALIGTADRSSCWNSAERSKWVEWMEKLR